MSPRIRVSLLALTAVVAMSSPLFATTRRHECTCVSGGTPKPISDAEFRTRWFDSYPIVAVMTMLRVDSTELRSWLADGKRGDKPDIVAWFHVDRRWTAFPDDSLAMTWSDNHTEWCGMPDYQAGHQYVVSTVKMPAGTVTSTFGCGTKPDPYDIDTPSAKELLRKLGPRRVSLRPSDARNSSTHSVSETSADRRLRFGG